MSVRVIFGVAFVTLAAAAGGAETGAAARCARLPSGPSVAVAATATRPLAAFRRPAHGVVARFGLRNVNDVDTVFSVVGVTCDGRWLHVELPVRPNGSTGWVRADHVRRSTLRTKIVVDLSERKVRFYVRGRLALESPAGVGSPATPTPRGRYYVNQRLVPSDPTGPFGPGAIGISAFSPVLTGWAQGGPVALHGTNEPWSIGRAVSTGCIRLPNAVVKRLLRRTPNGTPVIIRS
jgi:lipoprotein-anchoring transpeptidase ErfK/SrfK